MKNKIKKLNLFFVTLVIILGFGANNALATSGACSYHSGVNCSYGSTLEGKVMCNDGWINSSVYFSDADECKIPSCTPPSGSGCKTESDYGALSVKLSSSGGYLGGSASNQGVLNQCRNEIEAYQSAYQAYQQCLSTSSSNYVPYYTPPASPVVSPSQDTLCKREFGSYAVAVNTQANQCSCTDGYKFGKSGQCIPETNYCAERIGNDSYFDTSKQVCTCNNGYILGTSGRVIYGVSQCTPVVSYCAKEYGPNSWYNKEKGICEWNVVPEPQPIVIPPVTIPAKKLINAKINIEPKRQEPTQNIDLIGLATTSLTTHSEDSSASTTQAQKDEPKKGLFNIISQKILSFLKFIGF
jgi:hypothetical protein